MTLNLIYFLYPLKNDEWRLNVQRLSRYRHVFDGRKLVTVAQDAQTHLAGEVRDLFEDLGWQGLEVTGVENDPRLGEVPHFLPAVRQALEDVDGATFYAHAKGVSRPGQESVRQWRDRAYHHNLKDPELVRRTLQTHAAAGCFRRIGYFPSLSFVPWHFGGSFFWFSHARVREHQWWNLVNNRYAVEGWLGNMFFPREAACFYADHEYGIEYYERDLASWQALDRKYGVASPYE